MRKRLNDMTRKELQDVAKEKQVRGYSNMTKAELLEAIEKAARQRKKPAAPPVAATEPPAATPPTAPAAEFPSIKDEVTAALKARQAARKPARAKTAAAETAPPGGRKDRDAEDEAATAEDIAAEPSAKVGEPVEKPAATGDAAEDEDSEELAETVKKSELEVQSAKYQSRASGVNEMLIDEWAELPPTYGTNRVTLLPVDPYRLHVYWELTGEGVTQAKAQGGLLPVLRLYDVTGVLFNGTNAHSKFDIERGDVATSWYLEVPEPQRSYLVDVGYLRADGRLIVLARSNSAKTPAARPSPLIDEEFATIPYRMPIAAVRMDEEPEAPPAKPELIWDVPAPQPAAAAPAAPRERPSMTPEVRRIYEGVVAAPEPEAPRFEVVDVQVGSEVWQLRNELPGPGGPGGASEAVSSFAMSSWAVSSWARPQAPARNFWLVAEAYLVVYGATEPDAHLTVAGRHVPLRPDGTFELRLVPLPDGDHPFPIHAVAADGEQWRRVEIDVQRQTTPLVGDHLL